MHVPLSSYLIFCLVFISTPANFQTRCIPVITFPLCSAKLSTTSVLPISYSRAFLLSLALYRLATYPRSVSLRVVPMWLCGRENDDRVRTLTHHCLSLCSDTLTIAHCFVLGPTLSCIHQSPCGKDSFVHQAIQGWKSQYSVARMVIDTLIQ
jgi:hypothetical protein